MENEMDFSLDESQAEDGLLKKLTWLGKGFVFPLWSRPFYKKAAGKPLGAALVFLLVFAFLQTIVTTTTVAINLSHFGQEIEEAYLSGDIPDIRIENGIATASGSGKYIFESNRQLVGIDTTGSTQKIDTTLYSQGLLLTRTEIHLVNEDGYQVFPLTELNQTFGNPIVLDGASVSQLWYQIALFIDLAVLVGGYLVYSVGRFLYLGILGLVVWGAASLSKKGVDFAPILVTGIYAHVPTTYLMFILRKLSISFFGLRGLILLVIWGIAIAYVLKEPETDTLLEEIPDPDPEIS